jgi:polyhydroxyalkanoate synthesis repressor PhaR
MPVPGDQLGPGRRDQAVAFLALTRSVRIALAETGMATDEPILIKRYANRKLYDQGRSRYVTLEELEELIRQGREIRVVDAVSGDDLTSQTLAQIILDTARGGRSALPVAFLHQLIQHGMAWQSFVQDSLQSSLSGIAASQRETERALREWGAQAGWWPSDQGSTSSGGDAAATGLRDEVAALKEKIRDLESRLGG